MNVYRYGYYIDSRLMMMVLCIRTVLRANCTHQTAVVSRGRIDLYDITPSCIIISISTSSDLWSAKFMPLGKPLLWIWMLNESSKWIWSANQEILFQFFPYFSPPPTSEPLSHIPWALYNDQSLYTFQCSIPFHVFIFSVLGKVVLYGDESQVES